MKIVKRVGERLPRWLATEIRPVLAFTGAGRALVTGSRILTRRGWDALSERLYGWEKYGALAFTGYAAVYTGGHAPHIARFAIPASVIVWCVAAWWVAPPAAGPPVEEAELAPAAATPHAFTLWLLDTIGDRPGIHLRDLYPAMRQLPGCEGHDNARLRAALTTLGIPVHRSLRIGALAGRSGVRRADLEALPSPEAPGAAETGGDAGQDADSPLLSTSGEGH